MTVKSNDELQEKIYTRAIQQILEPIGLSFDSLGTITDGVTLPKLAEHLLGEKIPGWKEKVNKFQINPNLLAVTIYLAKKDRMFSMSFDLNAQKDQLGFIWLLLSKFYIKKTKRELTNAIALILKEYENEIPIRNMSKCWAYGVPFIALACKISGGSIKYENKHEENFEYIEQACEKINVPFILTPECLMCDAPDENCICIQAHLFLLHMRDLDLPANVGAAAPKPVQSQKVVKEEVEKPSPKLGGSLDRLKMRTDEYVSAANLALEAIEKESNAIDAVWINRSVEGVKQLGVSISNFNKTGLKGIKDLVSKARAIWDTVCRLSTSNKVAVPDVPVDYPSLNQKVTDLEKRVNELRNNLDEDSKQMKEWQDRIANANDLDSAKKVFEEIPYSKDNWKQLPPKSIMYLAGAKIEKIEKDIENDKIAMLKDFESSLEEFYKEIEVIKNNIKINPDKPEEIFGKLENSSGTITELNDKIQIIYQKYTAAKESTPDYSAEKPVLESVIEDLSNSIENVKDEANALIADKHFDKVQKEYQNMHKYIQDFLKVDGVYDKSVVDKAKDYAEDDEYLNQCVKHYKELCSEVKNAPMKHSTEEADALVAKYRSELEDAKSTLSGLLKTLAEAPVASYRAKIAAGNLGSSNLDAATKAYFDARAELDAALNLRTWEPNASGPVVSQFNQDIAMAEKALAKEFQRLQGQLKSILVHLDFAVKGVEAADVETSSPTIDVTNYEKAMAEARALIEEAEAAARNQSVLNVSGHDPSEVKTRLEAALASIGAKLEAAPDRIKAEMENVRAEITQASEALAQMVERVPVECARCVEDVEVLDEYSDDEFYSDDGQNDEEEQGEVERKRRHKRVVSEADCSVEEVSARCKELLDTFTHLRDLVESIQRVNRVFQMDVPVPDISEIAAKVADIDLLYRSTLFFQPDARAIKLIEEIPGLENPYGVLAAAVLAVKKFEERDCLVPVVGDFSSALETVSMIFDNLSADFIETTSVKALEMMEPSITRAQVEDIEILIDALAQCTPDAAAYVCKVQPRFKSRADLEAKAKALEINRGYTSNAILLEAMSLYQRIIDERRNGWVPGDNVIVVDAGSFNLRSGILDVSMMPKHKHQNSGDDFKSKLESDLARRTRQMSKYASLVNEALSGYKKVKAPVIVVGRDVEYYRDEIARVCFKHENVTGVVVASPALGIVLTSKKRTGVAVDLGNDGVTVSPVVDGVVVQEAVRRSNVGGNVLALEFQNKLADYGANISRKTRKMAVEDTIEKYFRVHSYDNEFIDGDIKFEEICFSADCLPARLIPEQLFFGSESVQELIRQAVYGAAEEAGVDPSELATNVVLAGGLAEVVGLVDRLKMELERIFEVTVVKAENNLGLVPYKAACMMAMEPDFEMQIITRSSLPEYDD